MPSTAPTKTPRTCGGKMLAALQDIAQHNT